MGQNHRFQKQFEKDFCILHLIALTNVNIELSMQQMKKKKNTLNILCVKLLIPLHFTFTFCFATFAYYFSLNSSLPPRKMHRHYASFYIPKKHHIYDNLVIAHTVAS